MQQGIRFDRLDLLEALFVLVWCPEYAVRCTLYTLHTVQHDVTALCGNACNSAVRHACQKVRKPKGQY